MDPRMSKCQLLGKGGREDRGNRMSRGLEAQGSSTLQHREFSKGGVEDRRWAGGPDGFWFWEAMSRIRSFIL